MYSKLEFTFLLVSFQLHVHLQTCLEYQNLAARVSVFKGPVYDEVSLCVLWIMCEGRSLLHTFVSAGPHVLLVSCRGSCSCSVHTWPPLIHRLATHESSWFFHGHRGCQCSCKSTRSSLHGGRCVLYKMNESLGGPFFDKSHFSLCCLNFKLSDLFKH
jgi:hypothetical protein